MARVVLPRDVVVKGDEPESGSAFTVAGDGRYVGWILRPAGAPASEGRALTGHRFGHCFTPGCAPGTQSLVVAAFGFDGGASQDYALPAGTYDLYLIPDGAPATVSLKFQGLTGSTGVQPEVPVVAHVSSPSGSGTGPANFESGSTLPVGAPGGMVFTATAVSGMGPGSGQIGSCIYEGGPPSGSGHCDDNDNGFKVPATQPAPQPTAFTVPAFIQVGPSDAWAPGGWFTGAMTRWTAGVTSVAVTFAELPAPDADAPGGPGDGDSQSAPPGAIVAGGRGGGGGPSAPQRRTETRGGGTCRPSLRAKRLRRRVTVVVATAEPCRLELRVLRRGREVSKRTVDVPADVLRVVTLRAPLAKRPRLRLVVVATDSAGRVSRRSLRVRDR
jgi:hypothetical protein